MQAGDSAPGDERTQASFAELDALARLAAGEQHVFVDLTPILTPLSETSSGASSIGTRPSLPSSVVCTLSDPCPT